MKVRLLKPNGIKRLEEFIKTLRVSAKSPPPVEMLTDDEFATPLEPPLLIDDRRLFPSRKEAGIYFESLFGATGAVEDPGLWCWLTLLYFDQVCPLASDRTRKPGELPRYIPNTSYRRRYRHLLKGPYLIVRSNRDNPDRAAPLLVGRLDRPGDIAGQFASRQEFLGTPSVSDLLSMLYMDPLTSSIRPKAAGKGPGSARRLANLLNQLDLTWDIAATPAIRLERLLPAEFNQFRSLKGHTGVP